MAYAVVSNHEQLLGLLSDLNWAGFGEAVAVDTAGAPSFIAAHEEGGDCSWDAFSTHPYDTMNDPLGLDQLTELEYELEEEGRFTTEGESGRRLYGISEDRRHPGLGALRYPLTVFYQER